MLGQARALLVHDGESAVAGTDTFHCGAHDLAQHLGQFQFPADRQHSVQQALQAFLGAGERVELLCDASWLGVHAQVLSGRERVLVRFHGAPS